MPSVRWRKVVRDLGVARTRTVLVVLSIAVGVFAVGTIAGANALLQQGLRDAYLASKPASATLSTSPFGDDLVEAVRGMPGIADAEPRRVITVRLRTGPETYRELQLTAITDFEDQRLDLVTPEAGATWPPGRGDLLLERSSLTLADVPTSGDVEVQTVDGTVHRLRVAGLTHEVGASPAFYVGRLNGHITFETLADLGYGTAYDELRILVRQPGTEPRRGPRRRRDRARAVGTGGGDGPLRVRAAARRAPRQRPARRRLPGPRLPGLPRPAGLGLPGGEHRERDHRPADAPDRGHEGGGRPEPPGGRPLPRHGPGVRHPVAVRGPAPRRPRCVRADRLHREPRQLRRDDVLRAPGGPRPRGRGRTPRSPPRRPGAHLARGAGDRPRGGEQHGHRRPLRAESLRPGHPACPRPPPPHPAVHPQHLPPQVAPHPDALGADPRRIGLHGRLHGPRLALPDARRRARLLRLRRPGRAGGLGPRRPPRDRGGAGARRRRGGGVAVRLEPADPRRRLREPILHHVRAAARDDDGAPQAPGGSLARSGRRQRPGGDRERAR